MATHLWDAHSPGGQELYSRSPYRTALNNIRVDVVQSLNLRDTNMMEYLEQFCVLGRTVREDIEYNSTSSEMNSKLINYLERGPVWKLHAFLLACCLSGQRPIVRRLGFDPDVYTIAGGGQAVQGACPQAAAPRFQDVEAPHGYVFDEAKRDLMNLYLSKGVGDRFCRLGIFLGFTPSALNDIAGTTGDFPLKMLIDWKQRNSHLDDGRLKNTLCTALVNEGQPHLQDTVRDSTENLERIFATISPHLAKNWESLAIQLSVGNVCDTIKMSNRGASPNDCAYTVFKLWGQSENRSNVGMLMKALCQVDRPDLARGINDYLKPADGR